MPSSWNRLCALSASDGVIVGLADPMARDVMNGKHFFLTNARLLM